MRRPGLNKIPNTPGPGGCHRTSRDEWRFRIDTEVLGKGPPAPMVRSQRVLRRDWWLGQRPTGGLPGQIDCTQANAKHPMRRPEPGGDRLEVHPGSRRIRARAEPSTDRGCSPFQVEFFVNYPDAPPLVEVTLLIKKRTNPLDLKRPKAPWGRPRGWDFPAGRALRAAPGPNGVRFEVQALAPRPMLRPAPRRGPGSDT